MAYLSLWFDRNSYEESALLKRQMTSRSTHGTAIVNCSDIRASDLMCHLRRENSRDRSALQIGIHPRENSYHVISQVSLAEERQPCRAVGPTLATKAQNSSSIPSIPVAKPPSSISDPHLTAFSCQPSSAPLPLGSSAQARLLPCAGRTTGRPEAQGHRPAQGPEWCCWQQTL